MNAYESKNIAILNVKGLDYRSKSSTAMEPSLTGFEPAFLKVPCADSRSS